MATDGGSIPSELRVLDATSPWAYAPAYLLHDWIFVAHKCKNGSADDNAMSFEDAALLMAEAMKTLMEKGFPAYAPGKPPPSFERNRPILWAMHLAVTSSYARALWINTGSVVCNP